MKKSWKDYVFVSIQFGLFGLYAFEFLPIYEFPTVLRYLGLVVAAVGISLMLIALLQLGTNFTAYPTPTTDAKLVSSGMYKFSRHPIYSGIILFIFGYGFWDNSNYKLIIAVILVVLFYVKTTYEEQQLLQKFRDYEAYQKKVNRFFPRLF
jgi:protein-S-isoprenylcysteine O-methyltransferase Ste14